MKDCTTCKYGFVDEQLGFPMCHHPSRFSEDCVDFNMHEDKEEPKKATGVEEKKLPEGLEEASWDCVLDSIDVNNPVLLPKYKELLTYLFIAGAEWMKAKMMEEAAECMVMDFSSNLPRPQVDIRLDPGKYHTGDKVKVIVIKEDEL